MFLNRFLVPSEDVRKSLPESRQALPDAPALGRAGVGRRQQWFAWSVIAAILLSAAVITPMASLKLRPIPGSLVAFSAFMIVTNLVLAALLFSKGGVEGRSDTIRLGAAYLYSSFIIIPQTASFPGALTPESFIGSPESALWLWVIWHLGFCLCVIRYAWFFGRVDVGKTTLRRSIGAVALSALAVSAGILGWATELPKLMVGGNFNLSGVGLVLHIILGAVIFTCLLSVIRVGAPTPEHVWLIVGLVATCSEVWLTLSGSGRFTLGWYASKFESLLTSLVVLISVIHEINGLYRDAALANRMLTQLAQHDFLTNLFNRRFFDERLELEFRIARRHSWPLSLIMIDVDHFKSYNDRYGHPGGDACLKQVAAAIAGVLKRPSDCAARYGGEEIAILLPATDLSGALKVAERLRETTAALSINHGGMGFGSVTISLGVACAFPRRVDQLPADLVKDADRALYQAKEQGRNRVVCVACDLSNTDLQNADLPMASSSARTAARTSAA